MFCDKGYISPPYSVGRGNPDSEGGHDVVCPLISRRALVERLVAVVKVKMSSVVWYTRTSKTLTIVASISQGMTFRDWVPNTEWKRSGLRWIQASRRL